MVDDDESTSQEVYCIAMRIPTQGEKKKQIVNGADEGSTLYSRCHHVRSGTVAVRAVASQLFVEGRV